MKYLWYILNTSVSCFFYRGGDDFAVRPCIPYIKQGYALKNWAEELPDEASYSTTLFRATSYYLAHVLNERSYYTRGRSIF